MARKVALLLFLLATLRPLVADSDDCEGKIEDVEDGQTEEDRRKVWEARQEMEARAQRQLNITQEGGPAPACYFFQGDIALRPEEALTLLDSLNSRRKRKVTSEMAELWTLPIPYRFSQDTRYKMDAGEQQLVRDALDHWTSLTCLTFQEVGPEVTNQTVLVFKKDSGCWSYVGRKSVFTEQEVSIGPHCFSVGTIAHEVGHAVGFWHEHSRPDRDEYIRVHYENVRYGEDFNFFKESWQYVNERNIPYDVGSIMHYGSTDFAQNSGALTIETRDPLVQRVPGQRQGLSFYDAKTANVAYCQHVCAGSRVAGQCQHDGYPDPKNCLRCRCPEGLHGTLCTQPSPPVVPCGGLLYIAATETYTIQSPGFPLGYQPGQSCAWLIKAPAGKSVFLRVSSRSFLHSSACTGFNTSVCRDFLEVKYNVSFSHTGARFCCSTPPDRTIVSNGPAMLVIFKALGQGQGGFIANISAESCGGCAGPDPQDQPACSELHTESCPRTWTVRRFVSCPVLFAFDRNCGRTVEENMTRNGTCTQERQFCCEGFALSNGRCLRQTTTAQAATPTSQTLARTPGGDVTESDAGRGWGGWGAWSPCSSSCGGCGNRKRTRVCDDPSLCGGRAEDVQSEVCNLQPCSPTLLTFCSQMRRVVYLCKLLPVTYCTRYESIPVPCRYTCCLGFTLVNNTCAPSNP